MDIIETLDPFYVREFNFDSVVPHDFYSTCLVVNSSLGFITVDNVVSQTISLISCSMQTIW